MQLPNGRYTIRSADGNRPIGTSEDKVIVLPEDARAPEWIIENVGSRYYVKTPGGKATAPGDNKLWVSSRGDDAMKWHFEAAFHHGKNIYIVQAEDRYQGWIAPFSGEGTQVLCRPLIVGPSLPPFYPPFERFIIERA